MSAMPAEVEPRPALIVLSPATARPATVRPTTIRARQAGLRVVFAAGDQSRPVNQRTRMAGRRPHPVGVRACSVVLHAEPSTAVLGTPQAVLPSLSGDQSRSLRLTRRGRVVLALCAAAVATLFGFAAAGGAQASDHAAVPGAVAHSLSRIVVQPGQTLWSIAVQSDPRADPRLVVQQIMTVNALHGGSVTAGQRLLVPQG